ncbi:neutral/alkaline non-lysosomal ceramidase N-terminal domain-containing protein [Paenibacillus koleovorans]|uniref:neutral/alkaline non-lysosomal ceramidase N-terminal domain-containing protein n=1 Tax=Paenibacillus koleovorans TaxID=121608 RepID=UPI000FDC8039|nr:neutral/alkaline non-lysosomal ceramidase N-terminal domain-containing protein [Paenibacillus koleovorans]
MGLVQLGISKIDITPEFPVPLSGFGHRRGVYEGISRRLYARVWLFGQENGAGNSEKILLVQADLIWWGSEVLDSIRQRLKTRWGLTSDRVLFHASHTHGGPQTTACFVPSLGLMEPAYISFLERRIVQAVEEAHNSLESVVVERGRGKCESIGINRRLLVDGKIEMAPHPDGVIDDEVTVIRFQTRSGMTKGVLFHFTCHPTTTSANRVTSDYCGAAMEAIDRRFGEGVGCFVQGCCGDIRPAVILDGRFIGGDEQDVDRLGNRLADAVIDIVERPMELVPASRFVARTKEVELPFIHVPSMEELQPAPDDDETTVHWKRYLLDHPHSLKPSAVLHLQLIQFSDELSFVALDGEIVVEYGLLVKRISGGRALPLGYSNGILGYVPTAAQIREGGYESDRSNKLFMYPSRFKEEIESNIAAGIRELLSEGSKVREFGGALQR